MPQSTRVSNQRTVSSAVAWLLTPLRATAHGIDLSEAPAAYLIGRGTVGSRTPGIGRDGVRIALIAAVTESSLRMLANTSVWPESTWFPNGGNGGDHDSLGLFQTRPLAGWGTVSQLMDSTYQARAFFGGDNGANRGSPRGLLDIPGWQLPPARQHRQLRSQRSQTGTPASSPLLIRS